MMLINGVASNSIPATDRGLQYGDGLFETIAVFQGRPQAWHRHIRRLAWGCKRLGISIPDPDMLAAETQQLCGDAEREILKILLTRGSGPRGYRPPAETIPTRILTRHDWPNYPYEWYNEGIRLHLCKTPLSCNPVLAGIKHINRLDHVMACKEWHDDDIAEGIMRDQQGDIVEGTMSNVFLVAKNGLHTPDLKDCGVFGTMRARVIEAAVEIGIPVTERRIKLEELYTADEIFVCNSILGVWGVRQFDGHALTAAPGAITRKIASITRNRD